MICGMECVMGVNIWESVPCRESWAGPGILGKKCTRSVDTEYPIYLAKTLLRIMLC